VQRISLVQQIRLAWCQCFQPNRGSALIDEEFVGFKADQLDVGVA
jgi:hypothetical protein